MFDVTASKQEPSRGPALAGPAPFGGAGWRCHDRGKGAAWPGRKRGRIRTVRTSSLDCSRPRCSVQAASRGTAHRRRPTHLPLTERGRGGRQQVGPLDVTGEIDGAPFRITVPGRGTGSSSSSRTATGTRPIIRARSTTARLSRGIRSPGRRCSRRAGRSPARRTRTTAGRSRRRSDDLVALASYFKDTGREPGSHLPLGLLDGLGADLRAGRAKRGRLRRLPRRLRRRSGDAARRRLAARDDARLRRRVREPASWGRPATSGTTSTSSPRSCRYCCRRSSTGRTSASSSSSGSSRERRGGTGAAALAVDDFPRLGLRRLLLRHGGGRRARAPCGRACRPESDAHLHADDRPRRRTSRSLGVDAAPLLAAMNAQAEHLGAGVVAELRRALRRVQRDDQEAGLDARTRDRPARPRLARVRLRETVEARAGATCSRRRTRQVGHCAFSTDAAGHDHQGARRVGGERREADERRLPGKQGPKARPPGRQPGPRAGTAGSTSPPTR